MSYKIKSDEVGSAVSNILYQFTADVQAGVRVLTDEAAEKLRKLIQDGAPVNKRRTKRRGTYKKSWRIKKTKDTFSVYEKTVGSPREYRLTHLLENGHRAKNGKTVKAQPHIKPAADKITAEYIKGIEKIIKTSQRQGGGLRTKSYKR